MDGGPVDVGVGMRRGPKGRSRGVRQALPPRSGLLREGDAATGDGRAAASGEAQPEELRGAAPARDPGAPSGGGRRGDDRAAVVPAAGGRGADAAGSGRALSGSGEPLSAGGRDPAGLLGGVELAGGGGAALPSLRRSDRGGGEGAGERDLSAAVGGAGQPRLGAVPEEGVPARDQGAADGGVRQSAVLRREVSAGAGLLRREEPGGGAGGAA